MITIFTKTICPYCQMAKQYLTEQGLAYTEVLYDDDQARQSMYDKLGLIGSQRTVPQIFADNERIGGYSDLLRRGLPSVAFDEEF
jgi:glutaredoxin 3